MTATTGTTTHVYVRMTIDDAATGQRVVYEIEDDIAFDPEAPRDRRRKKVFLGIRNNLEEVGPGVFRQGHDPRCWSTFVLANSDAPLRRTVDDLLPDWSSVAQDAWSNGGDA